MLNLHFVIQYLKPLTIVRYTAINGNIVRTMNLSAKGWSFSPVLLQSPKQPFPTLQFHEVISSTYFHINPSLNMD